MRKWGSFMGAGLAFALMKASDNNYRAIFLLASGARSQEQQQQWEIGL